MFDTWANIGKGDLLIHWNCNLDDDPRALFDQLVRNLSYLGRSESWIEAESVEDMPVTDAEFNAYPHVYGHHPGPGWEQISLLAAESSAEYDQWRQQAVASAQTQAQNAAELAVMNKGKKPTKAAIRKAREKAAMPYPIDLVDCLQKDTAWWKGHQWSQPPGSRRVIYWREADALTVSPSVLSTRPIAKPVTAMLLALSTASGNKSALPHVSRTLPQAELLHDALICRGCQGKKEDCPELIGKDENDQPLRDGHQHAHILPLDLDGDQHLDHILIYAPMGLGDRAQRAIRGLRRTWMKGGMGELQLALAGQGSRDDMRNLSGPLGQGIRAVLGLSSGGTRWQSITPFVPPRFEKRKGKSNDLESQVIAELASRDLPIGQVRLLSWNRNDTRSLRRYVRCRWRGNVPPRDVGYALRLTFSEPVAGPVSLGYGCHFGLGLFIQERDR